MNRKAPSLVIDLFGAISRCFDLLTDVTQAQYIGRLELTDRVNWNLVVAGEAAKRLLKIEPTYELLVPGLINLVSLRHRIAHGYFTIDDGVIWETVKTDLPNLIRDLSPIIDALPRPGGK